MPPKKQSASASKGKKNASSVTQKKASPPPQNLPQGEVSVAGSAPEEGESPTLPSPPQIPETYNAAEDSYADFAPLPVDTAVHAPADAPADAPEERKKNFDATYLDTSMELPKYHTAKTDVVAALRRKYHDAVQNPHRGALISTGIFGLDLCLHGGLTFGSIHEVYGLSKSGKTLVMISTAREAQRRIKDCIVVVLDRENAWDVERAARFGLDMNRTIIIPGRQIPTPQHAYEVIVSMVQDFDGLDIEEDSTAKKRKENKTYGRVYDKKKSPHLLFLIDSVPAFAEKAEIVEDQGRRAKMWHAVLRRMTSVVDPKIMVMVSNHIIYKPGSYGSGESKTTGTAIDYYRDCGIKCMRAHGIVGENDVIIGEMLAVEVDKTRRGVSGGTTFFPVYGGGAPYWSGIVGYAMYLGVGELSNKTAYKEGRGKVWPKLRFGGNILDESDPEFPDKLKASGLLPAIREAIERML